MTQVKELPRKRQFSMREIVPYVATRDVEPAKMQSLAEFRDIGSPGGPVVPRGQIRLTGR